MDEAAGSVRKQPSTAPPPESERTVGLLGATGVGIGAIVGGGILVLAGVAFRSAGPAAIVAFALNGAIAVLTALSFAEMSSSFPESGGAYMFAKKVLSVRLAFAAGWILWFAYIVAGVLYAFGFAAYAVAAFQTVWQPLFGATPPPWLGSRSTAIAVALAPTALYTVSLIRSATGGSDWATWSKVVVFVVLIAAGFWALATSGTGTAEHLRPFFVNGAGGLLEAMGFTFIALQGFDLIAAIGGEVKRPARTIPRAMLLSLGAALAIYLPLLLVVSTVGVEQGGSIVRMSERNPGTVMADAVRNYLGPTGYWLVLVAAILSMLSALHANLLAASRVASTMANDRMLPTVLGQLHAKRGTPVMAIYASALALAAILLMVPDLASAGAAASLIFLIAFALAHGTTILARRRSRERQSEMLSPESVPFALEHVTRSLVEQEPFRTPWFPAVPVAGGFACVAMAIFQGVTVPAAGGITALWLGLGVLLYFALFSSRAQVFDAYAQAMDPTLQRLRGRSPLVLVPVANPHSAGAMVAVAAALAPPKAGRVMLLSVMKPPTNPRSDEPPESIRGSQLVVQGALASSLAAGHRPEALMTIASSPWREIGRVARSHRCESLLLGLGQAVEKVAGGHLEELLNTVDCDVTFLRAPEGWTLDEATRILVPVGGRARHVELRARLLGSLERGVPRQTTWLTIVAEDASEAAVEEARRDALRRAEDKATMAEVEVVRSDDPGSVIVERMREHDLLVLGLQRRRDGRREFGEVALRVARETDGAVVMISQGA